MRLFCCRGGQQQQQHRLGEPAARRSARAAPASASCAVRAFAPWATGPCGSQCVRHHTYTKGPRWLPMSMQTSCESKLRVYQAAASRCICHTGGDTGRCPAPPSRGGRRGETACRPGLRPRSGLRLALRPPSAATAIPVPDDPGEARPALPNEPLAGQLPLRAPTRGSEYVRSPP